MPLNRLCIVYTPEVSKVLRLGFSMSCLGFRVVDLSPVAKKRLRGLGFRQFVQAFLHASLQQKGNSYRPFAWYLH